MNLLSYAMNQFILNFLMLFFIILTSFGDILNKMHNLKTAFLLPFFFIFILYFHSDALESDTLDNLQDNSTNKWEKLVSDINPDSIASFMISNEKVISIRGITEVVQTRKNKYLEALAILQNEHIKLYHYYLNVNKIKAYKFLKRYARKNGIRKIKIFKKTDEGKKTFKLILNALAVKEYINTPEFKRKKIEEYIIAESFFVKNKRDMDAIRSKYVLSPHEENYLLFHSLHDSVAVDSSYYGSRVSLNWRFSLKFPIVAARTRESGIFLFITNTGCFDFANKKESQPVCKKSFLPGAFYRFDFEKFTHFGERLNHIGVDNETDFGVYHYSNGGYTTYDRSRGINILPYIKNTFRIGKHRYDSTLYNVYSEHYLFTFNLKVQGYIDYKENKDLPKEWGYIFGQLVFEKAFDIKKDNGVQMIFWSDMSISKASQSLAISFMPVINKLRKQSRRRIPIAWYAKLYRGKDEYLLNYTEVDKWIGAGFMFRR